jgi:hypothetical protein
MDIPESMRSELDAWNNGTGIELEEWVGCSGNFSLAVGYSTVFWPEFVEYDGYILRKGFSESSLRAFEAEDGADRRSVELVLNHFHIADLQHNGCDDISKDKNVVLGRILVEIYRAKLAWQFPTRKFDVELFVPKDDNDLGQYQLLFYQL